MTSQRGELVRERRGQFGLPLPIADRVLPFRVAPHAPHGPSSMTDPLPGEDGEDEYVPDTPNPGVSSHRLRHLERRVAEAWSALTQAENRGKPERTLRRLEEAYLHELLTLQSLQAPRQ